MRILIIALISIYLIRQYPLPGTNLEGMVPTEENPKGIPYSADSCFAGVYGLRQKRI